MKRSIDTLVVGAGQAGLAAGYYLKHLGRPYLIIDKADDTGHVWRSRYDSLKLFTPRWYSSLPGLQLDGGQDGYAGKDEIARYLQRYAAQFELPVQNRTELLTLNQVDGRFEAATNRGVISANHVIVATGPFQQPFIPELSQLLSADVKQLHTAEYRNSSALNEGSVLVVGGGNSGAQIAVELAQDREVYLSVGHRMKFFPLEIAGKSIFWWFKKLGMLNVPEGTAVGRWLRSQKDPIFGKELLALIRSGRVKLRPKTTGVQSGSVTFSDGGSLRADNIVWATGFHPDYDWLRIPDAKSSSGKPIHSRGVSPVAGLYYVGLPWQHTRGSALLGGVGDDAMHIVQTLHMATR